MSHPQIKKIHHRVGCSDKHINNYKIPSERIVSELRYFVFLLFTDSLLSLSFYGTAEMPMCHGELVPQRLRAPTELIQVTADSFLWAFLCSSCGGNGTTATFSIRFCPTAEQFPRTVTCMTPHTTPVWLKRRNYSFLFTNFAIMLKELHCAISAWAAQHFCFVLPAQLQAGADIYQRCFRPASTQLILWKKTSHIIIVQIPLLSLPWQKKANSNLNEIKQVFFLYSSATSSIHTNLYHLPIAQITAILQYMERCLFIHETSNKRITDVQNYVGKHAVAHWEKSNL